MAIPPVGVHGTAATLKSYGLTLREGQGQFRGKVEFRERVTVPSYRRSVGTVDVSCAGPTKDIERDRVVLQRSLRLTMAGNKIRWRRGGVELITPQVPWQSRTCDASPTPPTRRNLADCSWRSRHTRSSTPTTRNRSNPTRYHFALELAGRRLPGDDCVTPDRPS